MKQRKQFTLDLFKLQSPNPVAPALESFVQIKYNEKKGRHLVLTQDVPAGTFKYHLQFSFKSVNIEKYVPVYMYTSNFK